jgi:hypothetical protein
METLIIHPNDRSTDFLRPIYEDIKNKTVITGSISRDDLRDLIKHHDQIIMLGHGSPRGLFNMSRNFDRGYIIGAAEVDVLRSKKLVAVWCHADKFMEEYQLPGLYSGMFISEVSEASFYNIKTTQDEVEESNDEFARMLGKQLAEEPDKDKIWSSVKEEYSAVGKRNIIAEYNSSRWFYEDRHTDIRPSQTVDGNLLPNYLNH